MMRECPSKILELRISPLANVISKGITMLRLRHWFRGLSSQDRHTSCKPRGARLLLEELEARRLLAGSVSLQGAGVGTSPGTINTYANVGFQVNAVAAVTGTDNTGNTDTNMSDFSAQINWGDGSATTAATLAKNAETGAFEFLVKGTHVYQTIGATISRSPRMAPLAVQPQR